MEQILNLYYQDNACRLRRIVDKILLKYGGLSDRDRDDFYSLANEVFADVIRRYDSLQPFDSFLYSCLSNRIKTEMTRRNREKRKIDRMSVSIDTPIGDSEDAALRDMIADTIDIERDFLEKIEAGYSKKMLLYLSKLSDMQKSVLELITAGYLPGEIRNKLRISAQQYTDCCTAIRSYRNISVLF